MKIFSIPMEMNPCTELRYPIDLEGSQYLIFIIFPQSNMAFDCSRGVIFHGNTILMGIVFKMRVFRPSSKGE